MDLNKDKKSLFICNEKEELQWIKKYNIRNYCIGTANYLFYIKCQQEGKEVVFFESKNAMAYKQIADIIGEINGIIEKCVKKEYLYVFPNCPVWEFPGFLAKILLYIDFFAEILRTKKIETVYTVDNKENWEINEAIFLVLQNQKEKLYILDADSGKRKSCLFTLKNSYYDTEKYKQTMRQKLQLDDFLKYWNCPRKKQRDSKNEFEIGVVYDQKNSPKNAGWIIDTISCFAKDFDLNIISIYDSEDVALMRERGFSVDCIEDYFNKKKFVLAYAEYIKSMIRIEKELKKKLAIAYDGINMQYYLYKKIVNRLRRSGVEKLYIDSCVKEYFEHKRYKLLNTYMGTKDFEGRVIYHNTRKQNIKLFKFRFTNAYYIPNYDVHADEVAIRIFTSERLKSKWLQHFDYSGAVYYVPEEFACSSVYKKCHKKAIGEKISILFTPGEPYTGLVMVETYFKICKVILSALAEKKCEIIVKNHPYIDKEIEKKIIKEYCGIENIKFVPSKASLFEFIKESDIVIASSVSTVLFDAAVAQRPVFGMKWHHNDEIDVEILDGFAIYDDAYKLCDDVIAIINDIEEGKEKVAGMIERQNSCMQELRGNMQGSFGENMCEILRAELARYDEENVRRKSG